MGLLTDLLGDGNGTSAPSEISVGAEAFVAGQGSPARSLINFHQTVWLLDDALTETVTASVTVAPFLTDWATFDLIMEWANPTTSLDDVRLRCAYAIVGPGDSTTDGTYGTPVTATAGAQDTLVQTTVLSGVTMPTATETLNILCGRYGAEPTDTLTGDIQFKRAILRKAS